MMLLWVYGKYYTQKFLREPPDQVFVILLCVCVFAIVCFDQGMVMFLWAMTKKDYTDNQIKILQTAALGEHVTLPCRVENKQGNLQWTRSTSSQLKSIIDGITHSHKHHIKNKLIIILNICSDCRDDFGLGRNRDLKGFERHHMSSFSPN